MRRAQAVEMLREVLNDSIPKATYNIVVTELKDRIAELTAQNNELWQKLMARNLAEYTTYRTEVPLDDVSSYDQFSDENNAGEILDEIES